MPGLRARASWRATSLGCTCQKTTDTAAQSSAPDASVPPHFCQADVSEHCGDSPGLVARRHAQRGRPTMEPGWFLAMVGGANECPPPCHIQAAVQPTRNFRSQCLQQPGATAEHLSVFGSGPTSVSLRNPLSFL